MLAQGSLKKAWRKGWTMGMITFVSITGCFASSYQYTSTPMTPFDGQMRRVSAILTHAENRFSNQPLDISVVNTWMSEIHQIQYQFSRQWQTPEEVAMRSSADCKGKALMLFKRMKEAGAEDLKLVIGKKDAGSQQPHAWLIWSCNSMVYLLDPTFHDKAWLLSRFDYREYIAMYAYDSDGKYRVIDTRGSYIMAEIGTAL